VGGDIFLYHHINSTFAAVLLIKMGISRGAKGDEGDKDSAGVAHWKEKCKQEFENFNYACNENYENPQKSFFLIDFFSLFLSLRPSVPGLKETQANNGRDKG